VGKKKEKKRKKKENLNEYKYYNKREMQKKIGKKL